MFGPSDGGGGAPHAQLFGNSHEMLPARCLCDETGVLVGAGGPYCWLVDPHDGTSALLAGERGWAVKPVVIEAERNSTEVPRCLTPVVMRTAKKGANVGSFFWGRSQFPRCRERVRMG